jgi:hypothetical protein
MPIFFSIFCYYESLLATLTKTVLAQRKGRKEGRKEKGDE